MAETLVIVESPSKAKTIEKYLGSKYRVIASNGHVRDLPKSQLGVDVEHDFEPKYITLRGRGEVIEKLDCNINYPVTLIKPKKLGISAKEAYTKYAAKKIKPQNNMTEKMIDAIKNQQDIQEFLYNDLEYAIFDDYRKLQTIKEKLPNSIMSGSGSTYFILGNLKENLFDDTYQVIPNLHFVNKGVLSEKLLISNNKNS